MTVQSDSARVVTTEELDLAELDRFLRAAFGDAKADFLCHYGAWLHRGSHNRLAVLKVDQIAAYCGVIPTQCALGGDIVPAVWWVDLFVAPQFRGQALQSLLDERVKQIADLELGFPNPLAARIHRRHGWALREDGLVMMLPLRPGGARSIRAATGMRGFLLRFAAQALDPPVSLLRRRLGCYEPRTAREVFSFDPDQWAATCAAYRSNGIATTLRDAAFLQWRYLDCPYRPELRFYTAGPSQSPSHLLVARNMVSHGMRMVRILDVYGAFDDTDRLRDLLRLALKHAMEQGASQVTAMVSLPQLLPVFRSVGFLLAVKAPFCWWSMSQAIARTMSASSFYWTLADSDNDLTI